jgi:multidrug efflux pump subunit AcrA (membrane-fusion protein)
MRPAMRFRGRIEIARVPTVVTIPLAAIESTATGPVVMNANGSAVPVRLGRRGREAVEVTGGLVPGDRILIRSATAAGKQPGFRVGAS